MAAQQQALEARKAELEARDKALGARDKEMAVREKKVSAGGGRGKGATVRRAVGGCTTARWES